MSERENRILHAKYILRIQGFDNDFEALVQNDINKNANILASDSKPGKQSAMYIARELVNNKICIKQDKDNRISWVMTYIIHILNAHII